MPACLLCGSTELSPLYQGVRDHYGTSRDRHAFLRCARCGSATLDPLPAAAEVTSHYSSEYTFKLPGASRGGGGALLGALEWRLFYRRGYRQRLAIVRRLTGMRAGRVLEVGCGSGLFLQYLREHGYDVEGVEMSKVDVDYARTYLGVPVLHSTFDAAPLPEDRYDLVLLVYVLEHLLDPRAAVTRAFRALRPGGWLVLGLPVIDSVQARLLGARWSAVTEAPRHVSLPSFAAARGLLTSARFREVRAAPSPLLENAGHIALSLAPGAASPCAHRAGPLGSLLRRVAGGLMLAPGLVLAWAERRGPEERARAGTMFFCGRR
jgi:SAM-dependent methyltransferase